MLSNVLRDKFFIMYINLVACDIIKKIINKEARKVSARRIVLICVAGLLMNLVGAFFSKALGLPVYLDTCGTVFIASLGGYVPGIAVGFFTNLTKTFLFNLTQMSLNLTQMYFASVSVMIAIITTFLSHKGFYQSFGKMLLIIPLLTFVTGTCDLMIETFFRATEFIKTSYTFEINFARNFFFEFLDKAFSVITTFLLLKKVPPEVKDAFRTLGQRQAPLTEEMKRVINDQKYLSSSLRTKMLLILTLSSLFVSFCIALISYLLFKDATIDERIKTVDGMVAVVVSEINPYKVDDYIRLGRNAPGYKETEERLYAIKNSSVDAKYLYVYRIEEDGCHVVFDLETAAYEADKPGMIIPLDKSAERYRADFLAGRPIPPIISDDEYGYLLTLYKPIYDYNGKCQCYAAVDFSMDMLRDYTKMFVIKLIALFLGCFVFIFAIGLAFVENNIILPLNTMAYCARNFSYDSPAARTNNVELINKLKIRTGDEIENLYSALLRTTKNILRYFEHLQRARTQVADMRVKFFEMDTLAHKDAMTGVKNKAAYNETIAALDKKISDGTANFCIVMIDVNYLKRINDNYGHEYGNVYLMNACRLVCAVFGEENVYRIGGDEFVVIIDDEKTSLVKYFVAQFKLEMERKTANESLKPWEKISAAVGTANYKPGIDKNAESVFKRADALMYENKLAMKAARTE